MSERLASVTRIRKPTRENAVEWANLRSKATQILLGTGLHTIVPPVYLEDVVQDAILHLFSSGKNIREINNGYLYLTVRSACVNLYRKLQRYPSGLQGNNRSIEESLKESDDIPFCSEEFESTTVAQFEIKNILDRTDKKEVLKRAAPKDHLRGLPSAKTHVDMLKMKEFDDMKYAEIAKELHVAVGTVKSGISRARAAVKRQLAATPLSP